MTRHRIAVIAGDGIGKEVVPEGIRVLDAAGRRFGFEFQCDELPWSCEYHVRHGRMMPEDGLDQIRHHDAIFLGAVGFPALVPDHVSLWGLLIKLRRSLISKPQSDTWSGTRAGKPTAPRKIAS